MTNEDYIQKYKDTDEILKTYYAVRKNGKQVLVDGIVNPLKIDNRQMCSVTDNQGNTPHCAAYSICNLAESIIWKRTGRLINLNADQVYAHAKMLDGSRDTDGTFLECAIQAALNLGGFQNPENIEIGFLYNDNTEKTIESLKFLIHKYDFIHIGCMITSGYYECTQNNPYIVHTNCSLGGHAMLGVGYDQDGLYVQNSWGTSFGSKGFCVLRWGDVLKELMYACYVQNCYDGMKD